jgi:hypothetical protein
MDEEKNLEADRKDNLPPLTEGGETAAEETSVSSEEKRSTTDEATQPSSLNLKSSTSDMEVHHHGHVHEQKKWKEYLFQFFMLFLAVFCGFLAEYQLEHMIEKQWERNNQNPLQLNSNLQSS